MNSLTATSRRLAREVCLVMGSQIGTFLGVNSVRIEAGVGDGETGRAGAVVQVIQQ